MTINHDRNGHTNAMALIRKTVFLIFIGDSSNLRRRWNGFSLWFVRHQKIISNAFLQKSRHRPPNWRIPQKVLPLALRQKIFPLALWKKVFAVALRQWKTLISYAFFQKGSTIYAIYGSKRKWRFLRVIKSDKTTRNSTRRTQNCQSMRKDIHINAYVNSKSMRLFHPFLTIHIYMKPRKRKTER